MTVPALLVTGFLGAGKTTMINALLHAGHGRRIAAIVNDFGAINIDAELLAGATDSVIGLKNGCICCSLQGDLLRTLRQVLSHDPPPEAIVIEASGVADPRGIVEMIMDPVLWQSVSLDAVVCVVDAADVAVTPERMRDPLWRAQLRTADFVFLAKTAETGAEDLARLRTGLAVAGRKPVFDLDREPLPHELLFAAAGGPAREAPGPERVAATRFATLEWSAPGEVSLAGFQSALGRIAPGLLRAKGFLRLAEKPGRTHLFQLVGRRATFAPVADPPEGGGCRLVLIGEAGAFDPVAARHALEALPIATPI